MIFTTGMPLAPVLLPPPHAVRPAARLALTATAVRVFLNMCKLPFQDGWVSDARPGGLIDGAPREESLLDETDQELGAEGDHRDDEHAGEDTVRIETVLRGADDQTQTSLSAQDLADQRTDDRETERGVEAGGDPGERRRHGHVPDDLQRRTAEDPGVGHDVPIHFPHALEGVEEDHEEHQDRGEQDLRRTADAEGDDEDGPEHDAGDRIHHLDEGPEHVSEERALPQQDAEEYAGGGAADEAVHGLL